MSNYLSGLIERARSQAPGAERAALAGNVQARVPQPHDDRRMPELRRRQPALFEPVLPWSGGIEAVPSQREAAPLPQRLAADSAATSRTASAGETDARLAARLAAQGSEAASARLQRPEVDASPLVAAIVPPIPFAPRPTREPPLLARPPAKASHGSDRDVPQRADTSPRMRSGSGDDAVPGDSGSLRPTRLVSASAQSNASSSPQADESKALSPSAPMLGASALTRASLRPAPAPAAIAARAESTHRPAASIVRARAAQASSNAAVAASPAALPPVQITIGRVEIRAVAPPAQDAARGRKATGPRLTLDDYLRERGGGSSR